MNENGLKILSLVSFLLLGYLVSGQQPIQDAFTKALAAVGTTHEGDSRLILTGITFASGTQTAVINGRILTEGESATLPAKPLPVTIKLLKITQDSVTIVIDGEDQHRVLRCK